MGNSSSSNTASEEPAVKPKQNCEGNACKLDDKPKTEEQKKLKPCCACPETKKARDTCIVERGEENCKAEIEAHKECMRKMGFNI